MTDRCVVCRWSLAGRAADPENRSMGCAGGYAATRPCAGDWLSYDPEDSGTYDEYLAIERADAQVRAIEARARGDRAVERRALDVITRIDRPK